MTGLNLGNNGLSGSIGEFFANNMPYLTTFDITNNAVLALPSNLGALSSLENLFVEANFISALPDSISKLQSLQSLYLDSNRFEGPIPASILTLQGLVYFTAELNHFTGSVPAGFASIPSLEMFLIAFNSLSGVFPEAICSKVITCSAYGNPSLQCPGPACEKCDIQSCPT